jgi:hypothetical protein
VPTEHPAPATQWSFGITDGGKPEAELPRTREQIIEAFKKVSGRSDFEFGELIWSGPWKLSVRMVEKFNEGRVFLCGGAL